jgi:hypothetical protein
MITFRHVARNAGLHGAVFRLRKNTSRREKHHNSQKRHEQIFFHFSIPPFCLVLRSLLFPDFHTGQEKN